MNSTATMMKHIFAHCPDMHALSSKHQILNLATLISDASKTKLHTSHHARAHTMAVYNNRVNRCWTQNVSWIRRLPGLTPTQHVYLHHFATNKTYIYLYIYICVCASYYRIWVERSSLCFTSCVYCLSTVFETRLNE